MNVVCNRWNLLSVFTDLIAPPKKCGFSTQWFNPNHCATEFAKPLSIGESPSRNLSAFHCSCTSLPQNSIAPNFFYERFCILYGHTKFPKTQNRLGISICKSGPNPAVFLVWNGQKKMYNAKMHNDPFTRNIDLEKYD